MKEIWVDVIGFENNYQVSNFGRVKSKDRTHNTRNKWGEMKRKRKGQLLKLNNIPPGYKMIELYKDGKMKKQSVHKIVYQSFIRKIPEKYLLHHKDQNPSNNALSNLEIMSSLEHNRFHSHKAWNKGIKTSKETQKKMIFARTKKQLEKSNVAYELKEKGKSVKEIALIMGYVERTIYGILKKREYYKKYVEGGL